ncbi:MAG TPA: class I SAM-dependent methyltransferase [bacterium]|nr:class I SAM-dependent methyltransferase [bacterium]
MDRNLREILLREGDVFRPSLENRIAYQHERDYSLLTIWMDRDRNKNIFRIVKDEVKRLRESGVKYIRILDIGCAYGNHIFMLNSELDKDPNVDYVGIDINPGQLQFPVSFKKYIPGYDNCDFIISDIETGLCFDDATFEIVLCSDVMEHLEDLPAGMSEISRVLKSGGKMIFTSPLKNGIFKSISNIMDKISGGSLKKRYYDGGTKLSSEISKYDDPEYGHGHVSEMSLRGYIKSAAESGLFPIETIKASVFSGSMIFDRHPFLLSALVFIESLHRVFKFTSWAHGVQIVFEKK